MKKTFITLFACLMTILTLTLTATFSDGGATYTLAANVITITYITNNGTTKHIIKDVGDTIVTLPENIIDDTQK